MEELQFPIHQKENNQESQDILNRHSAHFSEQCNKIIHLLRTGHRLTVKSALVEHNIGDLRARIRDIRMHIPVKDEFLPNSRSKVYFL